MAMLYMQNKFSQRDVAVYIFFHTYQIQTWIKFDVFYSLLLRWQCKTNTKKLLIHNIIKTNDRYLALVQYFKIINICKMLILFT